MSVNFDLKTSMADSAGIPEKGTMQKVKSHFYDNDDILLQTGQSQIGDGV